MSGTQGPGRQIIAIDGPAGAGKSTVARKLAARLGYRYVDSGAMYRVIGVLAAECGIDPGDVEALAALCDATRIRFEDDGSGVRTWVGDRDISEAIRAPEASQLASKVSAIPAVRERLVAQQRALGAGGALVMEGRDIGTVVFPKASLKIFLDASPRERARRRAVERQARGEMVDVAAIERDIAERDARDRNRLHSPMRAAEGARVIDTTDRDVDAIVAEIAALAQGLEGLASLG
jgi:cytidylate kinase